MKRFNFLLQTLLLSSWVLLPSCDKDEIEVMQQESHAVYSYTLELDLSRSQYDGDDGTRVTSSGNWEDGDVLHLRFTTSTNMIWGSAVYHSTTNSWTLDCFDPLPNGESQCSAWHGKGAGTEVNKGNVLQYDYLTEAYGSLSNNPCSYTCSNGKVSVSGSLSPYKRLRFKGNAGRTVIVSGDVTINPYYTICVYGDQNIQFNRKSKASTTLTVRSDGYTDYFVYYMTTDNTKIVLEDKDSGIVYKHAFDSKMAPVSGCFTLPTQSNRLGWTIEGTEMHEYVDLGLPSGTLWATCNIGADSPTDHGGYFSWGETEAKTTHGWSTYKYGNGENSLTKYCTNSSYGTVDGKSILELSDDAAYVNWGPDWCMPSKGQMEELCNSCTWTAFDTGNSTYNGISGFKVTGPNGNSIFLPASGEYVEDSSNHVGIYGNYWTTALNPTTPSKSYYSYFKVPSPAGKVYANSRVYGQSIRPVRRKIHEYVDLGLSSGTLWATCNIGADSPTDHGGYFSWGETEAKTTHGWSTYKYGNGENSLTKYCTNSSYGTVDGKSILELSDDAAYVNWGPDWCMPSKEQMEELCNSCTWTAFDTGNSTYNGISGFKVIGPNGNSIFLPASGEYVEGSSNHVGIYGNYWTTALNPTTPSKSY